MMLKYNGEEIYGIADVRTAFMLDEDGDFEMAYAVSYEDVPDFIYGSSADVGNYETLRELKQAIWDNNVFMGRSHKNIEPVVEIIESRGK